MNEIYNILKIIEDNYISLSCQQEDDYNPIEFFCDKVTEKEICHSRLLADLLNPQGKHKRGDVFLRIFLDFANFRIKNLSDKTTHVFTERPIERSLTSGNGNRRIDILITIEDRNSGKKEAIIIENKLNNARYQEKQLEDYQNSLKLENYDVIKCIVLCNNLIDEPKKDCLYLYCNDLVDWLRKCEEEIHDYKILYGYIHWISKQSNKRKIIMEAKKILQLEYESLKAISNLVKIYNAGMVRARSELIQKYIEENNKEIGFEFRYLTPYIQIWNQKYYDDMANKLWVEVYFNENTSVIKIVSDRTDIVDFSKENNCLYSFVHCGGDSKYYLSENYTFAFPSKEGNKELQEAVLKVLEAVTFLKKDQ